MRPQLRVCEPEIRWTQHARPEVRQSGFTGADARSMQPRRLENRRHHRERRGQGLVDLGLHLLALVPAAARGRPALVRVHALCARDAGWCELRPVGRAASPQAVSPQVPAALHSSHPGCLATCSPIACAQIGILWSRQGGLETSGYANPRQTRGPCSIRRQAGAREKRGGGVWRAHVASPRTTWQQRDGPPRNRS